MNTRLTIEAPAIRDVTLTRYVDAPTPEYDAIFGQVAGISRLRPFAALLHNKSERQITGLALIWTWMQGSHEKSLHVRTDSLFLPAGPVAPAGSKRLITASFIAPETLPGLTWDSSGSEHYATLFEQSPTVKLVLDTVIFSDGEVVGLDTSRTIEFIQTRSAAASSVSKSVLEMFRQGIDPSKFLAERTNQPVRPGDFFTEWTARIAQMILDAPDRKLSAQEFLATSMPALFRR